METPAPRSEKTVAQSRTEQVHIILPRHVNAQFRLFGGQLMEWIDVVAGVAARRHCGREVTTAAVDSLEFKAPAMLNDIVVVRGRLVYAGNTSMEVCVDTYVENAGGDGSAKLVNHAYLIMVALDRDRKPTAVPRLRPETDDERADYEAARLRREERKRRRG